MKLIAACPNMTICRSSGCSFCRTRITTCPLGLGITKGEKNGVQKWNHCSHTLTLLFPCTLPVLPWLGGYFFTSGFWLHLHNDCADNLNLLISTPRYIKYPLLETEETFPSFWSFWESSTAPDRCLPGMQMGGCTWLLPTMLRCGDDCSLNGIWSPLLTFLAHLGFATE